MISKIQNNNNFVMITIVLLILNFFTSLAVIYVRHLNIGHMAKLQNLVDIQDSIYQEWTQLLLEKNTLISYNQVDKLARHKLSMKQPENIDISIINTK